MAENENSAAFTNANLALIVGHIAKKMSDHNYQLVYGMWNPNFCSADAEFYAREIQDDLQRAVDQIKRRRTAKDAHEPPTVRQDAPAE